MNQNFVPLLVELEESDALYEGKLKILNLNKQDIDKEFRVPSRIDGNDEVKEFLTWSRLVTFQGDLKLLNKKMGRHIAQNEDDHIDLNPISVQNEISALELIASIAQKELSKFNTSIDEDLEIIKS